MINKDLLREKNDSLQRYISDMKAKKRDEKLNMMKADQEQKDRLKQQYEQNKLYEEDIKRRKDDALMERLRYLHDKRQEATDAILRQKESETMNRAAQARNVAILQEEIALSNQLAELRREYAVEVNRCTKRRSQRQQTSPKTPES